MGELTQYFVRGTKMFPERLNGDQQAIIMEVTLGRRLLANFLTIFLPTVLLNLIGHATNFFKAFFFEAVVTVNLTAMLVLTTMFINVSNNLPKTSYIKMMDIWLIFNLILPFTEVLLHTYKDFLRDEKREVNHHGRVRTLDEDGNEVDPDEEKTADPAADNTTDALKNNWIGTEPLQLALISRHEDVQVDALKEHYSNMTPNEKKLKIADFLGYTVIPSIAGTSVALYWVLGMIKYYSPEISIYAIPEVVS